MEPHVLRFVGNSYCYPIWGITSNQFGMWEVFGGCFDSALFFHDDPGSIMLFRRKRDRAGWYLPGSGCLWSSHMTTASSKLRVTTRPWWYWDVSQMCGFKDWLCHLICGEMMFRGSQYFSHGVDVSDHGPGTKNQDSSWKHDIPNEKCYSSMGFLCFQDCVV